VLGKGWVKGDTHLMVPLDIGRIIRNSIGDPEIDELELSSH
jgi:hypothetical protein